MNQDLILNLAKIYFLTAFLYLLILLLQLNQSGPGTATDLSSLATQALLWPKDLFQYLAGRSNGPSY